MTMILRQERAALSAADIDTAQYRRDGYIAPLRAFSKREIPELMAVYSRLRSLLPEGKSTQRMDWWHGLDRPLWNICVHPPILDAVERILGLDFYLWGTQFFSKDPGDGKTTPWHQDAFYWPLAPHNSVTVWLAFADSDDENGCMQVIPGTHRAGKMRYRAAARETDVLDMELEDGAVRLEDAVSLRLKAGEFSMHDDNIVHGSGPNRSDRLRCGLTLRYSAAEVRCDTSVWPFFKAFPVRGQSRNNGNPLGQPPTGRMTQYVAVTPES